jgi:uncharacterized protein YlxP (DUF503 family)
MKIAILQFELRIDGAMNLKDKRRVVKSVKDRLHREHMVAVAEVGALETWNVAMLGLVACGRDGAYLTQVLDGVLAKLRTLPEARLEDYAADIVGVDDLTADSVGEDGTPLWTPDERRDPDAPAATPEAPHSPDPGPPPVD